MFCFKYYFVFEDYSNRGRFLGDLKIERRNDKRILLSIVKKWNILAGLFSYIQGIHTLIALWPYCRYILKMSTFHGISDIVNLAGDKIHDSNGMI